jgi:elongation factor Ts
VPSAEQIQKLRAETGVGVMDAKRALEKAGDDVEKAREILREMGAVVAAKKGDRETKEGMVEAYIHTGGRVGVLLKIYCETDFVAKTEEFKQLARNLSMHIAAMNPENTEELLKQQFVKDLDKTITQLIEEYIAKLGENIQIGDFARYEL